MGLAFIGILIFTAIFAPLIIKVLGLPGPNDSNLHTLDQFGSPAGPSSAHPMGVDDLGRDVMSRVIYGSRGSPRVAVLSTRVPGAFRTPLRLGPGPPPGL